MADVVPISDRIREAHEATLRRHLEAHNDGDTAAVLATFRSPRIELIASGRVFDGADSVGAYLDERRKSFPDQRFEIIAHHHSDRVVIAELWVSGTHLGDLPGIAATGRRFRARMAAFFDFDGDELTGERLYYDAGTIARQLA